MKTLITYGTIGVILLEFSACHSKEESSRIDALDSKADALDNQAAVVRKDSKVDAADQVKQASMEADANTAAARASAEAKKNEAIHTADTIRQSGEQAAKDLEEKAKATRSLKLPTPPAKDVR